MAAKLNDLAQRLIVELKADKKRAAILGSLSMVLLVVVVRMLLPSSQPDPVQGEPVIVAPIRPIEQGQPVTPALAEFQQPFGAPAAPASAPPAGMTQRPVEPAPAGAFEAITAVPVDNIPRQFERDPFAVPQAMLAEDAAALSSVKAETPSFWDVLMSQAALYQQRQQERMQQVDLEIKRLVLQSTMTGPDPIAYVSGRLLRTGDEIEGFSVVSIGPGRITLSKFDFRRELVLP